MLLYHDQSPIPRTTLDGTCTRDPNESHYTVWTAWISIRVRVRVRVDFILQNLAPPGTTVHVPTDYFLQSKKPGASYSGEKRPGGDYSLRNRPLANFDLGHWNQGFLMFPTEDLGVVILDHRILGG